MEEVKILKKKFIEFVGQGMIRTGGAILLVPDPLPVVDEMVGLGLLVGGVAAVEYANTQSVPGVTAVREQSIPTQSYNQRLYVDDYIELFL